MSFAPGPRSSGDIATGGTSCVFENAAAGSAYCTDGLDNDGNGFTDREDLGCEVGSAAYLGTSCVGTSATQCGCSANEALGAGAAAVQAVTGTNKPAMILNGVTVTAVSAKGFWVSDSATLAASGHGAFVFTSSTPPASVVIGATLTVQGLGEQYGTGAETVPELEDPTIVGTPTTATSPVAATTDLATATGLTSGAPYTGVLVQLTGPFVVTVAPNTYNEVTLADASGATFTMDDEAFANFGGTAPAVNDCYTALSGVMDLITPTSGSQFREVNPRSALDMPRATSGSKVGSATCN
jgi:hypothetical protein